MAAWDKLKGESTRNYEYFEAFRMMGPGRSMLGAYNAFWAERGKGKRNSVSSSWVKSSERFKWRERSEAWDMHERMEIRKEDEKMRQKARNARKKLIMTAIDKASEALTVCDPESAKYGEIMTSIKTLSEQARIEFGDNTIVTPASHDILVDLISGEITVREAALRYNQEGIPIPESVKIMLSKEPPEEAEIDETVGIITEDELDRIYAERTGAAEAQKENFVPQRKAEVEELKAELADSFADQALAEDDAVEMI